ncbi:MAG: GSCFA domain-containing protein [Bacteroidota bacterium]
MQFTLNFNIEPSENKINIQSNILTIGSCFADVVGNQLVQNKIKVTANPFGTLFNPSSIFKLLTQSIKNLPVNNALLLENEGSWFHYDYHSQNNSPDKDQLILDLESLQNKVRNELQSADYLILTLGTAFAYQFLETKTYVANCHKMPANLFRKDLLHVKHICQEFEQFYKNIKEINPSLKIILTVSPVRHTKDGIPENQVSKSILRAACHYIELDFAEVEYFPAYEIMMDELRDYRFYESDMIHPNKIAEEYIYQRFSNTYFDENLLSFISKWTKIRNDLSHKPFNIKSSAHQKFLKNLLKKLEDISEIVNVEKEKEAVLSSIFVENSDER